MRMSGSIAKSSIMALVFAVIPISNFSTLAAGPQTPSCGNYKVTTNEVIVGVKFSKGTYQINAFGISCTKVMGSKGLFAKFLMLKDKDPLPKPWRYLADAVGAPKFTSGARVGFRVQSITTPTPIPTPSPTPTEIGVSTVSIDELKAEKVYVISRQNVNNSISQSSYINIFLNYNIGPNQKNSVISAEKDSINQAAKLWSKIYQPKEQLEVLFYNFIDLNWAETKFKQITGAETFYSAKSCNVNYCGGASAGRVGNGPWVYEQGLGGTLWNKSTSAHEYTHLAQTSGDSNYWNIAPLWLVEGMAQFYGEAIGYLPFDSNLKTRGEIHRQYGLDFRAANLGDIKTMLEKNSSVTVKSLMQLVEFPNPRHTQATTSAAYLLGSYATEVLVAVYGQTSVEQFISSFSTSSDWKVNFYKSFGISPDDFYVKLTPYLFEVSKEL